MIEFRDRFTAEIGAELRVHTNHRAIDEGANSLLSRHIEVLQPAADQGSCGRS